MCGPFPATSLHDADVGLKVPVEFVVKVTVPVGTVGFFELSTTLTVQVVAVLTKTDPWEQLTTVFVEWRGEGAEEVTARLRLPVLSE